MYGLGVASAGGSWTACITTMDGQPTNDSARAHHGDALAVLDWGEWFWEASLTSMDADGFTLDYARVSDYDTLVFSLAAAGVATATGTLAKSTAFAPTLQQVTGLGLPPQAVILASSDTSTAGTPLADARIAVGLSDGSASAAIAFQDVD